MSAAVHEQVPEKDSSAHLCIQSALLLVEGLVLCKHLLCLCLHRRRFLPHSHLFMFLSDNVTSRDSLRPHQPTSLCSLHLHAALVAALQDGVWRHCVVGKIPMENIT